MPYYNIKKILAHLYSLHIRLDRLVTKPSRSKSWGSMIVHLIAFKFQDFWSDINLTICSPLQTPNRVRNAKIGAPQSGWWGLWFWFWFFAIEHTPTYPRHQTTRATKFLVQLTTHGHSNKTFITYPILCNARINTTIQHIYKKKVYIRLGSNQNQKFIYDLIRYL
jgi:hypothetical protein